MPLKDRFRRLRRGSISADNSPPSAGSPEDISTGEQTPAMTKTPTAQSTTDLSTIGEVLTHQATLKAQAEGNKKKKRGIFRRKDDPYKDWPDNVYKPNEVPAPKYRRAPDPKHAENLSNFSFGSTASKFIRRMSHQSGVSPGGSRIHSRIGSVAPSQNPSRQASVAEGDKEDSGIGSPKDHVLRPGMGSRGTSRPATKGNQVQHVERIGEEDENAMSRQVTGSDREQEDADPLKSSSRGSNDMPFTQQELTQALSRATIAGEASKPVAPSAS